MPQYFTENGYETYSIGKVFHPNGRNPDDLPFSWNILPPFHPSTLKYKNAALCPPDNQTNLLCPVELNSQPEKTLPDIQTTKEAVRFLKSKIEDAGTITNIIKGHLSTCLCNKTHLYFSCSFLLRLSLIHIIGNMHGEHG